MTVHEKWLSQLKSFPGELTLPPPTLSELQLEYLEIVPGSKMVAKVPFQKRFTNPLGLYQGGMLTACIDEVFGPLSYLTAGSACMTLALNITYLGAFKAEMGHCLIEAVVVKKTKNFIFMQAEVKSPEGELMAHAQSHVKVLA
jgi:uncharacterized protein (TIGR00369 family)